MDAVSIARTTFRGGTCVLDRRSYLTFADMSVVAPGSAAQSIPPSTAWSTASADLLIVAVQELALRPLSAGLSPGPLHLSSPHPLPSMPSETMSAPKDHTVPLGSAWFSALSSWDGLDSLPSWVFSS